MEPWIGWSMAGFMLICFGRYILLPAIIMLAAHVCGETDEDEF
jgi:hypothetical protein